MKNLIYKWAMNYILKQHSLWRRTDGKKGRRLNFEGKHIPRTQFKNTNLNEACFSDATLTNCNFQRALFDGSSFEDGILHRTNFTRADLSFSIFHQAILRKVDFNLRAVNRQAEELERMKMRAQDLWQVADKLRLKDLKTEANEVTLFLTDVGIIRPRLVSDQISAPKADE